MTDPNRVTQIGLQLLRFSVAGFVLSLLAGGMAEADTKIKGGGDVGFWLVTNNVANNPLVQDTRPLSDRYMNLNLGLQLSAEDLLNRDDHKPLNFRIKGCLLYTSPSPRD